VNPLALWDSVWIALLTSAILFGAYRAVEWRWPERYLGMSQTFGLSSQETWFRFVLYRAIPTYVFAATCLVTVERLGGYVWVSGVVLWLASVAATHGKVVVQGIIRRWGEANYAGYHLAMILMLTTVLFIAGASRQAWGLLVPPPAELLSALWSGLLVAGLGGFVIFAVRPRPDWAPAYGPSYLLDRATRDVGVGELDWLFAECVRTGADPVLLKSLLVVEAVQRPKWLRQVERLGFRFGMVRTSGVMQISAPRPLSDRESITAAAEAHSDDWTIAKVGERPYHHWSVDLGNAWAAVTTHNGDARFASNVASVADFLVSGDGKFFYFDDEHRTVVLELRRYSGRFALRGVTSADSLLVVGLEASTDSEPVVLEPKGKRGSDGWWAWEHEIDPSTHRVLLCDLPSGLTLEVKLRDAEIASIAPARMPWNIPAAQGRPTAPPEGGGGRKVVPGVAVYHDFDAVQGSDAYSADGLVSSGHVLTRGSSTGNGRGFSRLSDSEASSESSAGATDTGPSDSAASTSVDFKIPSSGPIGSEDGATAVSEPESALAIEPACDVSDDDVNGGEFARGDQGDNAEPEPEPEAETTTAAETAPAVETAPEAETDAQDGPGVKDV
jgi:hypothetical protein